MKNLKYVTALCAVVAAIAGILLMFKAHRYVVGSCFLIAAVFSLATAIIATKKRKK